jgi:hypothetical protein
MALSTTFVLVVGSAAVNGLLAGASLDQSVKQLPARLAIGNIADSKYSRAADLGNGIASYSILGVGAAVLAIAAAWSVAHPRRDPRRSRGRANPNLQRLVAASD